MSWTTKSQRGWGVGIGQLHETGGLFEPNPAPAMRRIGQQLGCKTWPTAQITPERDRVFCRPQWMLTFEPPGRATRGSWAGARSRLEVNLEPFGNRSKAKGAIKIVGWPSLLSRHKLELVAVRRSRSLNRLLHQRASYP